MAYLVTVDPLQLLLIGIFAAHLLCVDLAMAAPLVAVWLDWRASRKADASLRTLARELIRSGMIALALGAILGLSAIGLLWALEYDRYLDALGRIPLRDLRFMGAELAFYWLCMAACAKLIARPGRWLALRALLALAAATNLLYHFPPLFVAVSTVSTRPELHGAPVDRRMFLQMLADGEVLSRVLHHWLASLTVAGLATAILATRLLKRHGEQTALMTAARQGGGLALVATLVQLPVGLWVLLQLPQTSQDGILGGDGLSAMLFGASLVAAMMLLYKLASIACGEISMRTVSLAAAWLGLVVLLMSATLHRARDRSIEQASRSFSSHAIN